MNELETDWTVLGDVFMMFVTFILLAFALHALVELCERYHEKYEAFVFKLDAYLFESPKKWDQRKVRKTR